MFPLYFGGTVAEFDIRLPTYDNFEGIEKKSAYILTSAHVAWYPNVYHHAHK